MKTIKMVSRLSTLKQTLKPALETMRSDLEKTLK